MITLTSGVYSTSLKGPLPPSQLERLPFFSTTSRSTMAVGRRSATTLTNGAKTVSFLRRTVYLSTTSAFAPGPRYERSGTVSAWSISRSTVYLTSSAVSSRPPWNLTPWRSLNSTVVGSTFRQDSATSGFGLLVLYSMVSRLEYSCS